jgi:MFS family permease
VIDGLYQGAAAVVRLAGGMIGDRWRRHKEVAVAGYGLSALTRLALPLAGSGVGALSAVVFADRMGKGIRTAPRDALISLSTAPARLGAAFGVHRALDTAGAMLGPVVAFLVLALATDDYDAVFVVSFCVAVIGLSILVLFVRNPPVARRREERRASPRAVAGLLGGRRYRRLAIAGALLGLATMSDGFVYLRLQDQVDFRVELLPLLFVGTAFVYMVLAAPLGRLADRIGRLPVFLGGHVVLLLLYAALLLPSSGAAGLVIALVLFGTFYAATDGVLMALASAMLPESLRGSGLALMSTATGLARLGSSVLFGALWAWAGMEAALLAFGAALPLAIAACALMLAGGGARHA